MGKERRERTGVGGRSKAGDSYTMPSVTKCQSFICDCLSWLLIIIPVLDFLNSTLQIKYAFILQFLARRSGII
jgi:hypothetical protein